MQLLSPSFALAATAAVAALVVVQVPGSHCESGEFKQPTPHERYRQDGSRNNLVHPPGYATAPVDTFGEVTERGTGERAVILIGGLGPSWRVFDSLIEAHEDEYRFIAVTLAGYGGSSAPPMPEEPSFANGAWLVGAQNALHALIDERSLERPLVLAFYSEAARVAVRTALAQPDSVGGLLIVSASPRFPLPVGADRAASLDMFAESWFKTVTEIMWPSGMWPPAAYANDRALAEKTWWDVLEPTLPTAVRYTLECWSDDLVPELKDLRTPTVVLSPGFDEAFLATPSGEVIRQRFHAGWEVAVKAGAPIEHTIVAGARLLVWEDRPEEVHGALKSLARRAAGDAPR